MILGIFLTYLMLVLASFVISVRLLGIRDLNMILTINSAWTLSGFRLLYSYLRERFKKKPIDTPEAVDASMTFYQNGYNYAAGMLVYAGDEAELRRQQIEGVVNNAPIDQTVQQRQYYEGIGQCLRDWVKHAKPSKRLIVVPGDRA